MNNLTYGFGDPQTWGGRTYEPSAAEIFRDELEDRECDKLAEVLSDYPSSFYDAVIESEAWNKYIDRLVENAKYDDGDYS